MRHWTWAVTLDSELMSAKERRQTGLEPCDSVVEADFMRAIMAWCEVDGCWGKLFFGV